jgi:DNA-binding PadR family transcriptional regulator
MEFVLLGLLTLRAMTVYEINKALERGISLFYSASFGSINAALEKMSEKGWITAQEKVENGRNKKVYSLTPLGQQAFQEWLRSELQAEKVKDPALTRVYFMGFLPQAERIRILEGHLNNLRRTLDALTILQRESAAKLVPEDLRDVFDYQMLTLQYGCDFYSFNIAWYENLLQNLKQGTTP